VAFAFGLTLVAAGLVTSLAVTVVGALTLVIAVAGWCAEVWPVEATETVTAIDLPPVVVTRRVGVARIRSGDGVHRARLPIEIYPVSAGIKGGIAGSVAMALFAALYGLATQHGVWYPINLLAAGFLPRVFGGGRDLAAFDGGMFVAAGAIHLTASLLVGLLYGAMLPMIPRRPLLLGGIVAPLMWTGLLYTSLDIINPVMNQSIDWKWFVLSQFGFGVTAGLVVARQERISTWPALALAVRAGLEGSPADDEEDPQP
jgi:hypothetical protein